MTSGMWDVGVGVAACGRLLADRMRAHLHSPIFASLLLMPARPAHPVLPFTTAHSALPALPCLPYSPSLNQTSPYPPHCLPAFASAYVTARRTTSLPSTRQRGKGGVGGRSRGGVNLFRYNITTTTTTAKPRSQAPFSASCHHDETMT